MPDPLSATDSTTRPFARRLVSEIVLFSGVAHCVGGQVLQHLLEASRVAVHALGVRRDSRSSVMRSAKRLFVTLGHATKRPRTGTARDGGRNRRLERARSSRSPTMDSRRSVSSVTTRRYRSRVWSSFTPPGRQRFEIAAHRGERRHQLVRDRRAAGVGPIRFSALDAGLEARRHPVERFREGGHSRRRRSPARVWPSPAPSASAADCSTRSLRRAGPKTKSAMPPAPAASSATAAIPSGGPYSRKTGVSAVSPGARPTTAITRPLTRTRPNRPRGRSNGRPGGGNGISAKRACAACTVSSGSEKSTFFVTLPSAVTTKMCQGRRWNWSRR